MSASATGFGRFHGQSVNADACLGVCVLSALVAIPVAGTLAAMAFLAAGLSLIALRPLAAASDLMSFKALLILPAFCVASTLWSDEPAASLRFGLQLGVTFVIAVIAARRLPAHVYLVALMIALLGSVGASILFGSYRSDTGALTGFYASKNAVGLAAAFLALVAVGAIDVRSRRKPLTWLAGLGAVIGLGGVYLSQSLSAVLAFLVGMLSLATINLFRQSGLIKCSVVGLFASLLIALGGLLVLTNFEAFRDAVLGATGKDLTLTGRTELWATALDLIEERPILGAGYQAFWVPQNALAQSIWYRFGIESQSGFSFHNTYLSNAVEIGLLGVAIQIALIAAALGLSLRAAIIGRDRASAILAALVIMIISLSGIDTHVFFQLSLPSVILISAIVYGRPGRNARME